MVSEGIIRVRAMLELEYAIEVFDLVDIRSYPLLSSSIMHYH